MKLRTDYNKKAKKIRGVSNYADNNSLQLLRNATLVLKIGELNILIDPMFAEKKSYEPFSGAGNRYKNPLTDLPLNESELTHLISTIDAVFITHTHQDHWDKKAQEMLPKDILIFTQPTDKDLLISQGFTNVIAITNSVLWNGIFIHRTPGQHGFGKAGRLMGDVSGFIFEHGNEKIYIAGDTRWNEDIKNTIREFTPQTIVLNTGGCQFIEGPKIGDAITMTPYDIIQILKEAPYANLLAVHMDALNHCHIKRRELKNVLRNIGYDMAVQIPDDGYTFSLN